MIEEGTYRAKATSPISWQSSTKGKADAASVRIQLLDGKDQGSAMQWTGYLTENAIARATESLEHMGWDGSSDDSVTRGQEFLAVVQHEEYEGKTRAKILFVNALDGSGGNYEPMAPAARLGVIAKMKAFLTSGKVASLAAAQTFDKF